MNAESYKLKKKYGIALRRILTTNVPSKKFVRYLGATPQEFKRLIVLQLKPEFTMDNYGRVWVLDHIVPVFLFDQEREDDLLLCWNYINTIPMPLRFSRLKGVSLEFALEELELRAAWCPNKSLLEALKKRMVEFVASVRVYHSMVAPGTVAQIFTP